MRDLEDRWIRIWVKKGAMVVLPEGIYHRFTLDTHNFAKASAGAVLRRCQGDVGAAAVLQQGARWLPAGPQAEQGASSGQGLASAVGAR